MVPSWLGARDACCATLLGGDGCLLTGLPGTGKSLLIRSVAQVLRSTGWKVGVYTASLPSQTEFAALTGCAAILIDDAHRLTAAEFEMLDRSGACPVLMAGPVGLEERRQIDTPVVLPPLSAEEVPLFVSQWLKQTTQGAIRLDSAAMDRLSDASAGVPRLLAGLMTTSLEIAMAERASRIGAAHVEQAAWRQVEQAAEERANQPAGLQPLRPAPPNPARPGAEWEQRLAQVPFLDQAVVPPAAAPSGVTMERVLLVGGIVLFVVAVGLLAIHYWLYSGR